MDYLNRSAEIAAEAKFTEKESCLFINLTNPLLGHDFNFIELYHLFEKLIKSNQGVKACELYEEKQDHYEAEPSAYPEFEDDVRIG